MTLPASEIDLRERKCYYDETGMEIGEGDLLQVYHFRHYIRKQKIYMYHVAILEESQGTFWWAGKEYNRHDGRGHYWLKAVANKETGIIRGTKVISTVKWEDWEKRRKAAKTLIKSLTTTQ